MPFVATGGGSGGHVYPALAIIQALFSEGRANLREDVLYLGTAKGIEADLVIRAGIPFASVRAGAVRGRNPMGVLRSGANIAVGLAQAWLILRRYRPRAILATGGYVCFPVVVAGWLRGIPSLIYLPDVEPGLAIRCLAQLSQRVAVTSSKSEEFLPSHKVVETGYPVRPEFFGLNKEKARAILGLDPQAKTLLILGGSQGAHSLNLAVSRILGGLLEMCQIVHLSGANDWAWLQEIKEGLSKTLKGRYILHDYLHEKFPYALAAADLAVSRAGASVLGEFTAVGLPGILVPYPHAGKHQERNAQVLQEAGAAVILEDSRLDELLLLVQGLLKDESRLAAMAQKARGLARPGAATHIARLLAALADGDTRFGELQATEPGKTLS